jgi:NAD(P)-dependent dehydrogenase (short-subunit alcohol dehydrogenase family)
MTRVEGNVTKEGDATEAAKRDAALKTAIATRGGYDILFNNAGTSAHGDSRGRPPRACSRRLLESVLSC